MRTTQPTRRRYAVRGRDGWHAVERGHRPVEGEWNVPTACGFFIVGPYDFARGLKNVTCEDCRGR